jgi:hypothetical protein
MLPVLSNAEWFGKVGLVWGQGNHRSSKNRPECQMPKSQCQIVVALRAVIYFKIINKERHRSYLIFGI